MPHLMDAHGGASSSGSDGRILSYQTFYWGQDFMIHLMFNTRNP